MPIFKDSNGNDWNVTLDTVTAKEVRARTGIDLPQLFTTDADKLMSDPCKLVDVLYVMLERQCKERGLSDEQFGRAMVGDALEAGGAALVEAVIAFFPQSRRAVLCSMRDKSTQLADLLVKQAMQNLDGLDVARLASTGLTKPIGSAAP